MDRTIYIFFLKNFILFFKQAPQAFFDFLNMPVNLPSCNVIELIQPCVAAVKQLTENKTSHFIFPHYCAVPNRY